MVPLNSNTLTTIPDLLTRAERQGACREARTWLAAQPDLATAYAACPDPRWLLWLARRRGVAHAVLARCACDCARTALRYVPAGEERPRLAIEAAEAFLEGRIDRTELRQARDAAAAADADAAAAAYAAAYAAYAYADASASASAAADASASAAYAAAYADASAADARQAAFAEMADLVRARISLAMLVGEVQS